MPTDQTMLIGLFALSFLLAFALIAMLLLYASMIKRTERLEQELEKMMRDRKEFEAKAAHAASEQAKALIDEAGRKAQEIIKRSQMISDDVRRRLETQLEQLPISQQAIYRDVFKQVGEEAIRVLHQVSDEMRVYADREVKAFGAALQERVVVTQEEAKRAIEDSFRRIEEEIGAYKSKRLQKIDESINQVVREATEEILGKAIHPEQHQELVIKALETAKQANVI